MEKLTFYKIAIIVLIVLNIGTLIFIYLNQPLKRLPFPPPHPRERIQGQQPRSNASEFIIHELGFNKEQEEKFIQLWEKHHEQEIKLHDSLHIVKNDFFNLLSTDNTEKAKIYAQIIGNLERERELNTFKHFKEVRKLCDAQQQEKFDRIIKDVLRMMAGPPK